MLEQIPTASQIREMSEEELKTLSSDIREFLVEKTAEKGGHLASNLGMVELTLALVSAFDLPQDKIIFDVGHQVYAYKMLTGRMNDFDSLRDLNGLSGFPKRKESPYDAYDTGHSSTSISAGLGYVKARDLKGTHEYVVAVIGDGSMTGGEAYEALNNASSLTSNFIIVLNDNEMSISKNVGGMNRYLTNLRAGRRYNRMKMSLKKKLTNAPGFLNWLTNLKDSIKELFMPDGMFFENMGIKYLGPVDGHDVKQLEAVLENAKELNRAVLIHVKTKKGKGYEPAEKAPDKFHGVNPFDPATGKPKRAASDVSYSGLFGGALTDAAKTDPKIVAITAAMTDNVGLEAFAKAYPSRFFDVGIAEQHAVSFAAGLACGGYHPYVAIFSSFLQRAYDQIVHDVCMQDLPVTFCVDRAGIVGRDGETHQGVFDTAFLSSIPNMTIMAPKDAEELSAMIRYSAGYLRPLAIRYPRGTVWRYDRDPAPIEYGKAEVLKEGEQVTILAFGSAVREGVLAEEILAGYGIRATLINMRFIKPWDQETVKRYMGQTELFAVMEDGVITGGACEHIASWLLQNGYTGKILFSGVPDVFVPQGNIPELKEMYEMDGRSTAERIRDLLGGK
ncbi:MAG: 1-deoxy-D-xylulose-5-phosphate synthase [Lachnospiraceae bacterium]|nr:1-deoxy-D-xylulose-5-phosphate synthase [Lachnospiraceae bacterium]